MRVLCHGLPFFRDYAILDTYQGPHHIRTVSANATTDYRYDPARDTWPALVERIAREYRPDLALMWTPENDPPPPDIELSPVPTVALAGDWNLFGAAQRCNLGRYDLVLCDKPGVRILTNDLVTPHFLFPLYTYDPALTYARGRERDIDVLYLGNMNLAHYRRRGPLLERVARLADRYRVVLACGVFGDAYGELLGRAKIVFNHSVRGELNLRVFESIAAGALALIEASNEEARDFFTPDQDIVLYTEENLEARICECIDNWSHWRKVAVRGHGRATDFACADGLNQIIDWAAAQSHGVRPFLTLPTEERLVQTYFMYAVSQRPAYGSLEQRLAARLANSLPTDPRAWAAVGRSFYAPKQPTDESARGKRCIAALMCASDLSPESAPYAFNVAEACRLWSMHETEEKYLRACLAASTLEGEDWLIGSYQSAFWTRWLRALAERRTSLAMLHSEAWARLAIRVAPEGRFTEALDALEKAERNDPEAITGTVLKAELLLHQGRADEAADHLWRNRGRFFFDFGYRDFLLRLLIETNRVQDAEILSRESHVMQQAHYPSGYGRYRATPPPLAATAR